MSTAAFIYLCVFAGLMAISFVAKIMMKLLGKYDVVPKAVQLEEFISIPLMLIACGGLYGYVYDVALFNQLFWQLLSALFLAHIIFCFWLPKQRWMMKEMQRKHFVVLNVVGLLMGLPFYLMLVSYAFFSYPIEAT